MNISTGYCSVVRDGFHRRSKEHTHQHTVNLEHGIRLGYPRQLHFGVDEARETKCHPVGQVFSKTIQGLQ